MFVPWWDNCWPSFTLALQARFMLCPSYQLSMKLLYIYICPSGQIGADFFPLPSKEHFVYTHPMSQRYCWVLSYPLLMVSIYIYAWPAKLTSSLRFAWEEHARAMLGPCLGHVYPISTLRLTRVLKFSWLSQISFRDKSTKCLENGTIQWPYLDHVGLMFG